MVLWFARLKAARFHDCGYVCRMAGNAQALPWKGTAFTRAESDSRSDSDAKERPGDLVRFRSALVVFVVRVQKADNQAFS
ncbi:MAG: hypothetical protein DMG97_18450 [Acidobacteria bacterium]|nr:MAG: hypothetical protein DMG97_18450 [Acidobacteriota bacterium]PYV74468.1 MAG: hypothetical protein DMG96_20280 [Acidobacteriota bacterium]